MPATPPTMTAATNQPVGWQVPVGWKAATVIVCFPAVVFGIVGSLAYGLGIPFAILAVAAIHRCTESHTVRNGTPQEFIFLLAALESLLGMAVLSFFGPLGVIGFAPSLATAVVGWGVKRSSEPVFAGPSGDTASR